MCRFSLFVLLTATALPAIGLGQGPAACGSRPAGEVRWTLVQDRTPGELSAGESLVLRGTSSEPFLAPQPEHFRLERLGGDPAWEVMTFGWADKGTVEFDHPRSAKTNRVDLHLRRADRREKLLRALQEIPSSEGLPPVVLRAESALHEGSRYRLTWSFHPVGSTKRQTRRCEFEIGEPSVERPFTTDPTAKTSARAYLAEILFRDDDGVLFLAQAVLPKPRDDDHTVAAIGFTPEGQYVPPPDPGYARIRQLNSIAVEKPFQLKPPSAQRTHFYGVNLDRAFAPPGQVSVRISDVGTCGPLPTKPGEPTFVLFGCGDLRAVFRFELLTTNVTCLRQDADHWRRRTAEITRELLAQRDWLAEDEHRLAAAASVLRDAELIERSATEVRPLGDGKVLEIDVPGEEKRLCWFEAKGDPLVEKHVLRQIGDEAYLLFKLDAKMPPAPEMLLRTGKEMPAEDVPCWRVSAVRLIDGDLWVALIGIARPKMTWWTGEPPHPHHTRSGGDPYEGGILRVDLETMAVKRWTSEGGLPKELVCHDTDMSEPLPPEILFGAVVTDIGQQGDQLIFTTRNSSRVLLDPQKEAWTVEQAGEPKDLLRLLGPAAANRPYRAYAVGQLGVLRAKEAVPTLIEILANGLPNSGADQQRHAAMEALIAIDDPSAVEGLRPLAGSENLYIRRYAEAVILSLKTPLGKPVAGLRFRLTTRRNPFQVGSSISHVIDVQNVADHEIILRYRDPWPRSPDLVLQIRREDGSEIVRLPEENYRSEIRVIKPGQVERIFRWTEPLPPGRYRLRYQITIPEEYAKKNARATDPGPTWHGSVTTNEITVEVLPPGQ
ncbi:MAG TPA: hypothetical protein VMY42_14775 [Thermoguttaceae bacterium]|nr:hypothetical protein [Thermoguttaceae bacterium]